MWRVNERCVNINTGLISLIHCFNSSQSIVANRRHSPLHPASCQPQIRDYDHQPDSDPDCWTATTPMTLIAAFSEAAAELSVRTMSRCAFLLQNKSVRRWTGLFYSFPAATPPPLSPWEIGYSSICSEILLSAFWQRIDEILYQNLIFFTERRVYNYQHDCGDIRYCV